ncbi:MAG: glycosyltransferase family 2 protein [Opitutae bacterium]|nr:glycosyltransferase family 2 protein [Opitutae bacterium]MBT6959174.1 glycosyltransferase family 2 protein [Opitutae bacterium]
MGRSLKDSKVSLVIPLFNEEGCVRELFKEISTAMDGIDCANYEVVLVDDCSRDKTLEVVEELAANNSAIKCLSLSRNVGHQNALSCGLNAADGDIIITLDGDLQHPPALFPEMLRLWEDGADVVNTIRRNSGSSNLVEKTFSKWFYRIFNRVAEVSLVPGSADFRLLDRQCVDALNGMTEHFKFFRGQVPYIGFKQVELLFDCPPRFSGNRSYTLRQSFRLASNGIFSFSTFGLKLPFYFGSLIIFTVFAYFVAAGVLHFTGHAEFKPGWLSLAALIYLSLGLQMFFLGMYGLYLGKIFVEVKSRPGYFIKQRIGFDE